MKRILIGLCLIQLIVFNAGAADSAKAVTILAADYPTLQTAFDALPKAGGLVIIPPGDYELSEPLILRRENTRITGSGPSTHLINKNEKGQPALLVQHPQYPEDKKHRLWRVEFAHFRISGNPKSGDGLRAEGINEIFIQGVSIDHNGGNGINLINCYEDPRISDNIITYNKQTGLNIVAGHDIVVNANQFEENQDALRCIDSYNLCMNGNNLDDHLGHGVVIENTYGSVLSGNMIEECQGTAVVLDRDCYGNTISANVIAHNVGGGIDLRDAWGCGISANTFTINPAQSITVGPESGRITITGNNFSNAHIGGKVKRDDETGGILLDRTSYVVISGNVFSGMAREAIRTVGKCEQIVCQSNIFCDFSRSDPGQFQSHQFDRPIEIFKDNSIEKK